MSADRQAVEQIEHEAVALCNRYSEESDLDDMKIVKAVIDGLNSWLEEELIEFESE